MSEPSAPDRLLGGRLVLHQAQTGHRAGTDAVLLAAAADLPSGSSFVDVGAGVGTVGLAIALRSPDSRGVLLELDARSAALAQANIVANGFENRVSVVTGSLFDDAVLNAVGAGAALVVTNPPFFEAGQVRASPDKRRATAHVLGGSERHTHADWLQRSLRLLAPRGRFLTIHRADMLPYLLAAAGGRLGGMLVRPVQPRTDRPAIRVLFGGTLASRAPLSLLPPLVLHGNDGRFTEEATALHEGTAMAFWPEKSRPRRTGTHGDAVPT